MIKYGAGAAIIIGQLTKLCNNIWTGRIPTTWKDSIIIPLPKNGDLRECTNWRGITLVNPRKNHGQGDAESYETCCGLRQEQAGFRPGRSCCEQIFTLRQIIEKKT